MTSLKIFVLLLLYCGRRVDSEAIGFNFQQPSSKWAIAASYSWVIGPKSSNYPNDETEQIAEQGDQQYAQQRAQQIAQQRLQQLAQQLDQRESQLRQQRYQQLATQRDQQIARQRDLVDQQLARERDQQIARQRDLVDQQLARERDQQIARQRDLVDQQLARERDQQLARQRYLVDQQLARQLDQQLARQRALQIEQQVEKELAQLRAQELAQKQAEQQAKLQSDKISEEIIAQIKSYITQLNQLNSRSNSISYPRESYDGSNREIENAVVRNNFNYETKTINYPQSTRHQMTSPSLPNGYQKFVDEIVSKAVERTTAYSNTGQSIMRGDIERIVQEILSESQLNGRGGGGNSAIPSTLQPSYLGSSNLPFYQRLSGINGDDSPQSLATSNPQSYRTYPHFGKVEPDAQMECLNCINTQPHSSDNGPIAIAAANSFYPGFTNNPQNLKMAASSFAYTSV